MANELSEHQCELAFMVRWAKAERGQRDVLWPGSA
jgi:hypothetical protein